MISLFKRRLGAKMEESFDINATHGFQKIEGFHVLELRMTAFEEGIGPEDKVLVFHLADGHHLLIKDSEGIEIKRVTATYIMFKTDVVIKEI